MLQCIYQQPNPFEKFVYDSQVRKKSSLTAEFIFCHHTLVSKVWIVADLYSQLDPPLVSAHTLRKNTSRNEKFIADIMHQENFNISFYKYTLNNCHIRRTSTARQRNVIEEKLRELKKWQRLGCDLNVSDKEWIDNTIALDYSKAKPEKKVYLGFTTYVYNDVRHCNEQLGETVFSHAIYDSSEFFSVTSCPASFAAYTMLILKIKDCLHVSPNNKVHLLLTDEEHSWQAEVIGEIINNGICFVAPVYTGKWNPNDGNRLIDIKVLKTKKNCSNSVFKFVYV